MGISTLDILAIIVSSIIYNILVYLSAYIFAYFSNDCFIS